MAIESGLTFISSTVEAFKEGQEEARRERAARELRYQSKLVENFNYSPKEFYALLAKNLEKRRIPGLQANLIGLYESITGSARRLYLSIARERFVFYTCAAPFGSAFFLSWRLVDERRPAKWYHIIGAFLLELLASTGVAMLLTGPFRGFLLAIGVSSEAVDIFNYRLDLVILTVILVATWSAMRLGALPGQEWLANLIEKIPLIGRIFERFYRPDTYYRRDTATMYEKAFDAAISETIEAVTNPQVARIKDEFEGSPLVTDLHRR